MSRIVYSISVFFFKLKKFSIFFSKFFKSSSSNALDKESIGTLCLILLKIFEGLNPTFKDGDSLLIKLGYFFSIVQQLVIAFFYLLVGHQVLTKQNISCNSEAGSSPVDKVGLATTSVYTPGTKTRSIS